MTTWLMYLIVMLDSFSIGVFFLLLTVFVWFTFKRRALHDEYSGILLDERHRKTYNSERKKINKLLIPIFILFAVELFVPNTKEVAAIYFVPKVINNKQIKKMPDKLVNLANKWMDEELHSIKETTKK